MERQCGLMIHPCNGTRSYSRAPHLNNLVLTRLLPPPREENVVPAEYGDDPHGCAGPGQGDHDERALLGAAAEVAQRRRDGPVAVKREDEQVEDGGRRGGVVHRQPELAHHVAEPPVACGRRDAGIICAESRMTQLD